MVVIEAKIEIPLITKILDDVNRYLINEYNYI